jgi:hypothetical protein
MSQGADFRMVQREIEQETDAEIAFGRYLEQSGVDCDQFMAQWNITQSQFNRISHFVYGLSDDLSTLPSALAALLLASRGRPLAA